MNRRNPTRFFMTTVVVFQVAIAASAREFVQGPWRMTIGKTDVEALRYKDRVLVTRGGLRGYRPGWKGNRFGMDGSEITQTPQSVSWSKKTPDNQEAELKAEFGATTVRFSLKTTVTAAGPTEFWVEIAPEAVRIDENRCFVWLNGEPRTLSLTGEFDRVQGIKEIRFEQENRTVIVRCSRFEMQDRRASGSGLFLVKVIGSSGAQPRTVQDFIEIEVREADPGMTEGRRALLSQRPISRTLLPVKNAGFEASSLDGWSRNPLAALDRETKHGGKQSARLTISGKVQERGQVYLIQSVPVVEGRLYQASAWIKGRGVNAANVGGMWPVGATIILEFADKTGKWFAPGNYGPKQYGTFDWRSTATSPVAAPEGAGFAIVYLALRGTGTAWFDDVTVTRVKYPILLVAPLTGQQVHDNTPRLQWYYKPKALTTLELSRGADFPEAKVIRVSNVGTPSVQIEKPLPPGKWYWRVRAPGVVSGTWVFEQTAGLDEDTTDPVVEECHAWLPSPTAPLRVRYSDNTGVTRVTLTVDGRDVSERVDVGRDEALYVPENGWAEGLHTARVRVRDRAGNSAEHEVFATHSKRLPKTVWRKSVGVRTDGRTRFLLGMYGVRIEDMAEMAAAGFDFVHSYQWDGAGTNAEALEYLDAAQRHGLQAFIGFNRQRLMAGDERFVAERVGALMRHPALFAWYLYDEPDLSHQYVSPTRLERYYHLITALDPFHPVVVTCARDDAVAKYRDAFDVHWTQVYGSTAFVASRLEKHRKFLHERTPLAAILHCYDRGQSRRTDNAGPAPDPARFQPDGRLMRANAFMAIAHNSSCLVWWWWGYGGSQRYFTVANAPKAWRSLKQTVADIESLRPVLTAEGEIHTWTKKPARGTEVHVWEKRLAHRTVLIAVNRDKAACRVSFNPKSMPETCRVTVQFEGREVKVQNGELTDTFEPLAVHVYQWRRDR